MTQAEILDVFESGDELTRAEIISRLPDANKLTIKSHITTTTKLGFLKVVRTIPSQGRPLNVYRRIRPATAKMRTPPTSYHPGSHWPSSGSRWPILEALGDVGDMWFEG